MSQDRQLGIRVASRVYEVDAISILSAQVATMNKRLDSLSLNANVNVVSCPTWWCGWCGEGHVSEMCSSSPEFVNFVGKRITTQIVIIQSGEITATFHGVIKVLLLTPSHQILLLVSRLSLILFLNLKRKPLYRRWCYDLWLVKQLLWKTSKIRWVKLFLLLIIVLTGLCLLILSPISRERVEGIVMLLLFIVENK